jgi:hypothetical protein
MSDWETLHCENHPDRIALERCEVCHKPLCAYCLYYTEDGQRPCQEHAEEARRRGLRVEEPGTYAAQLIGAQAGATRKEERGRAASDEELYKGNSNDLMAFVGLLTSGISAAACCGGAYCLPLVGFVLSLVAVINAKKSFDPKRTRRLGVIGLLVSGVWVVVIASCILMYGLSVSSLISNLPRSNFYVATLSFSGSGSGGGGQNSTATPVSSPTYTATPEAEEPSVWLAVTPEPE